jgi:hypothetical protein
MSPWTRIGTLAGLLLLAQGSPAQAATTVSHFKVKEDTAVANFQATDPGDPCLENFVTVIASRENMHERYNPCADGRDVNDPSSTSNF